MKHLYLLNNLTDIFPFSNQKGTPPPLLNQSLLNSIAHQVVTFDNNDLMQIVAQHHEFLNSGNGGGKWKVLFIQGVVTGIYDWSVREGGTQASFEYLNISGDLKFGGLVLPFVNFCCAYANAQDFSDCDFSGSLFTDAVLKDCNFENSRLVNVDFSRANLQGVNFRNADLRNADFENCDLTGVDFRGAQLGGASFPGCILSEVLY